MRVPSATWTPGSPQATTPEASNGRAPVRLRLVRDHKLDAVGDTGSGAIADGKITGPVLGTNLLTTGQERIDPALNPGIEVKAVHTRAVHHGRGCPSGILDRSSP